MNPLSTAEVVRTLTSEGFSLTVKRLEGLLANGHVAAPRMVGPVRVWMPEDLERVREVLRRLDGTTTERARERS